VEDARLALLAEAIALPADVDGGGVVQEPVEDRRGEYLVGEDVAPVAVALVAGDDQARLPVPAADELEEELRGEAVEREVGLRSISWTDRF